MNFAIPEAFAYADSVWRAAEVVLILGAVCLVGGLCRG